MPGGPGFNSVDTVNRAFCAEVLCHKVFRSLPLHSRDSRDSGDLGSHYLRDAVCGSFLALVLAAAAPFGEHARCPARCQPRICSIVSIVVVSCSKEAVAQLASGHCYEFRCSDCSDSSYSSWPWRCCRLTGPRLISKAKVVHNLSSVVVAVALLHTECLGL